MHSRPLSALAAHLNHLTDPDGAGTPDAELLRRFADDRDESAFELLVWRHGGLVLAACRRVLGRSADADDAFQATFLALARKPGAVRRGEALPGWLHRVAVRAAGRLRAAAARRARLEAGHLPPAATYPLQDDTAEVLDEEIARLPDKLRVAFVLCHLQGRTHEEAAEQLGCPRGTVLSRVARARERLQARLARRGFVPTVGLFVGLEQAVLPSATVAAVVRAALAFAAGAGAPDPTRSEELAGEVLRPSALPGAPVVGALAAVVLAVGAMVAARTPPPDEPPDEPPPPVVALARAPAPKPAPVNFKLAGGNLDLKRIDEVRFSPDGRWCVVAGKSGDDASAVVACDARTGKLVRTLAAPAGVGSALEFSPDGRLLATSNIGDASVTVWRTADWALVARFEHILAGDLAFTPDGRRLLSRSHSFTSFDTFNEVNVWDVGGGRRLFAAARGDARILAAAAFSPDGKTLAVGTNTGAVLLLDAVTGRGRGAVQTGSKADTELAFAPDGRRLLTWTTGTPRGSHAWAVRVWNVATGAEERRLDAGGEGVSRATFSPDGRFVLTVGDRDRVRVWDAATGDKRSEFRPPQAAFLAAAPNGQLAAVWGGNADTSVATLYTLPDGNEVARLPGAESVAFSPDGALVAVAAGAEVTVRSVAALVAPK